MSDGTDGRIPVRIAVAQVASIAGDKRANVERADTVMRDAADAGAQAIVFPELFLTGYALWDRLPGLAEPLDGPRLREVSRLAREHSVLTVLGFPERTVEARPSNSALIVDRNGSVAGVYRKTHLFGRERDMFSRGSTVSSFGTSLGRVGVLICYDLEFPEPARLLALEGARVVLAPTANMEPYAPQQRIFLRCRALENGIFIALANTIGDDGTNVYVGNSGVADPDGSLIAAAGRDEQLLIADLDLSMTEGDRLTSDHLGYRRPELYVPLVT